MNSFNPETHEYFIKNRKAPGVTGVLKEAGFIDGEWYTEESRQRGTAVHEATQFLDEDDLDWDTLHPKILPYVKAYEKFKLDTGFKPDLVEHRVFSDLYHFGGTLDRTGTFPNGDETLLDIKSGAIAFWTALQTAAYDYCLDKRRQRMAVQLKNDGTYKVKTFKDPNDIKIFLSAAVVVNWKRNQRGVA